LHLFAAYRETFADRGAGCGGGVVAFGWTEASPRRWRAADACIGSTVLGLVAGS